MDKEEGDMSGRHRAAEVKLPPPGNGQIKPDPADPRYDKAETFGKPFGGGPIR